MKAEAIRVTQKDNVVIAVHGAAAGQEVHYFSGDELCSVVTTEEIPPCHKIAIEDIPVGGNIIKYGQRIGGATKEIKKGGWVSHNNIRSLPRDYESET